MLIGTIGEKAVFEFNRLMTRTLLKNFKSHPDTNPLETNPNLGVGNGHAQSRDLHLLVPLLVALRTLNCKSILDLGSGDGFVLRVAESLGFSNCFGVEGDPSLCEVSRNNLTYSVIYNSYFKDVSAEYFQKPVHLIYFFNPDQPTNMLDVCLKLRDLECKYYLTKNHAFDSDATSRLSIRLVWRISSYKLYQSMKTQSQ